jgi:hypothetical protein
MVCHQQHCREVVGTLPADVQDDVADVVVGIDEALTLQDTYTAAHTHTHLHDVTQLHAM